MAWLGWVRSWLGFGSDCRGAKEDRCRREDRSQVAVDGYGACMEVECPARSSCLGLLGSVLHSQWRELFGSRSCFVQQERVVWVSELFRPARSSCLGLGASAGSFVQSAMVDVCSARRSCFVQLCSPVCPASLVVECRCVSGVGLQSGLFGYVAQVNIRLWACRW